MAMQMDGVDAGILGRISALLDLAPAGFAMALHVRYQTPAYLFQTYPEAWREEYSNDGLVMRDPIVAWGFGGNTGVTTWAALDDGDPDGVIARARRHGLNHGLALSLERGGSRSFAGFARSDRPFDEGEVGRIVAAVEELHDLTASAAPLPPRTREGLRRLSVAFTHP